MVPLEAQEALHLWPSMAPVVYVPHTEDEYERIVALLDQLIDEVGEEESHPLASLMEILGVLVEAYETEHVPEL
jgi:HTH-type transcriptional regulator/antitoxin HigA